MRTLVRELTTALVSTVALGILVCGIYPAALWGLSRLFSHKADGSLVLDGGKVVGSELIGQHFAGDKYFTSRPSSAGTGYDAANSSGSNLGPLSQKLIDGVKDNVAAYRKQNGLEETTPVPADAVLGSSSGLDPHISVENALLQAPRVARVRGMSAEIVRHYVEEHTEGRDLGFLGEPRVNVFLLNRSLDLHPGATERKP
ncbi:MAG TPA: K(+)-transporting ATPase subunit C [Planctomycetota bacterium]|nr:K(+)-transporting ATPase subunit C [Planctomycetota bacterium]